MRQQNDIVFQPLLKRARTSYLTQKDVNLLNNKISKELPTNNNFFLVVVIQINAKKHLINWHQIYKMARKKSQNVYIFSASHIWSNVRGGNFMSGKKLFHVQDRSTVTRPELLYYTKGLLTTILSNVCRSISLVNEARYQAVDIVPDENSMSNF